MPPAIAIAAVGLAVATVGTVASISNANKSANAQREAQKYTRQQDNMIAARNRREAIRAARQSYAAAQQTGENQGVAQSSGAQGGQGSIVSQINSNLSFLDQYAVLGDQASVQLGRAAGFKAKADTYGAVANFGDKVFSNSGTIAGVFGG
jgi:hypothetical protein